MFSYYGRQALHERTYDVDIIVSQTRTGLPEAPSVDLQWLMVALV